MNLEQLIGRRVIDVKSDKVVKSTCTESRSGTRITFDDGTVLHLLEDSSSWINWVDQDEEVAK